MQRILQRHITTSIPHRVQIRRTIDHRHRVVQEMFQSTFLWFLRAIVMMIQDARQIVVQFGSIRLAGLALNLTQSFLGTPTAIFEYVVHGKELVLAGGNMDILGAGESWSLHFLIRFGTDQVGKHADGSSGVWLIFFLWILVKILSAWSSFCAPQFSNASVLVIVVFH